MLKKREERAAPRPKWDGAVTFMSAQFSRAGTPFHGLIKKARSHAGPEAVAKGVVAGDFDTVRYENRHLGIQIRGPEHPVPVPVRLPHPQDITGLHDHRELGRFIA